LTVDGVALNVAGSGGGGSGAVSTVNAPLFASLTKLLFAKSLNSYIPGATDVGIGNEHDPEAIPLFPLICEQLT
jgi:hypothetical protein